MGASNIRHDPRRNPLRVSQQGSEAVDYKNIRVWNGPPRVTAEIAANRGCARPCTPQRSSVGKSGSGAGRGSHLFKVPSFVSIYGNQSLSRDADELLSELRSIQDYYDNKRRDAPIGTTTPEVQSEDWTRIGDLVNALTACSEFAKFSPVLSNPIGALQPLLGQPGQARYGAWTAVCRNLKNLGRPNPARSTPRGASAGAATPLAPQMPATTCLAAKRGMTALRDRYDARVLQPGANRQLAQNEVNELYQHVSHIMSNQDAGRHFPTSQEWGRLNDLWYRLNQRPVSAEAVRIAWVWVKDALPATST